jgi:hypothetical protein
MTYLVLALLAVAAGAFFGAVRPGWPWRRPQPVRGTVSFGLLLVAFVVLIASGRWDYTPPARSPYFAAASVMGLVAVWIAPWTRARLELWGRLTVTLAWAWLAFKVYGRTW